ncbi:MarR family winged helix-turn-helix transcriptional regulator [Paenibacillus eucommiae]|uniref:DNA-binding MarR family transcriptional regulator n=1 Tax=Paenibacillus eucommiae TaxID=1355755 RepID=A0ABS4J8B3_9BACL|nr:MarR family transcriptional regulator [Paenibacillus eucommiae]MBP1996045.1 DNA-binding MarR family transcriptional regulator [Paenibacillus eucommiae]
MGRKNNKEHTSDQLPKLGVKPYIELMGKTASKDTDRNSAYIGLLMLWLGDNTLDAIDLGLSSFGITESKLDLLLLLTLHEGRELVTPSALADRLGIRRASVTALLDWLEKRRWIIRQPSELDRRMIHVSLTPEGRDLLEQVLPAFWSTCSSIIIEMDPEERIVLEKILLKLNASLEKRMGVGR